MITKTQQINRHAPALRLSIITAILSLAIILGACTPAPEPVPTPAPTWTPIPTATAVPYEGSLAPEPLAEPHFEALTYSIQAFLWWDPTARPRDLEQIRLMNFSHVKQMFPWNDIQPEPDTWLWEKADAVVAEVDHRELQLIARIDHPPAWAIVDPATREDRVPFDVEAFAHYCGALAERYTGQIAGYQIWNEPNLQREWAGHSPDAAGYVTLLQACHDAIKAADPAAIIISAGLAPTDTEPPLSIPDERYLQQLFDAGLTDAYDVLGLHAPGFINPPEMSSAEVVEAGYRRWMGFRHVEDMRRIMILNGDADKQVAILEFGWTRDTIHPEYEWFAVDEETQAEYLVNAYQYAAENWRPWVGLMSMIYIAAPDWTEDNEEYWWAITTNGFGADYRVLPAFIDLANMAKVTGDTVIEARDPGEVDHEPLSSRD